MVHVWAGPRTIKETLLNNVAAIPFQFLIASTTNITICNNQLPYTWNKIKCLTAGTYSATLAGSEGADSIAILNLSVVNVGISVTNIIICDNQLPYTWNGHSYSASGTYSVTLTSSGGCDSVPILSLTVNNFVTSTTSKTLCSNQLPYTWNGNSYTAAGVYKVTLKSRAGCDSLVSLILYVNPMASSTTSATICDNQLPYSWNGRTYSAAGVYSVILTASNGCDSVAKLDLKVSLAASSITRVSICPKQLPYTWNGKSYPAAGTYPVTLKSYLNCDSIANLVLSVTAVKTTITYITICDSQLPYTWNGNTYPAAGIYLSTLTGSSGCDSVAKLQLVTASFLTSTTSQTICNTELPYTWNGNSYTSGGTYTAAFATAGGCDSVATLKLVVETPSVKTDSLLLCAKLFPFDYYGHIFTAPGDYPIVPSRIIDPCHSIDAVHLVVQPIPPGTTVKKLCSNQLPYTWNGKQYTIPGYYSITLISSGGCDSTANLDLSVNPVTAKDTSINICISQTPYNWNGHFYSSSGTYVITLTSSDGCDSVMNLHLTVSAIKTSITAIAICNAQLPFTWNSNVYTSSGTYNATITGSGGCDSIATLHLFVQSFLTSSTNIMVCNNQLPYNWNGNTYTTAGTYVANLVTGAGCDSVATLNLAVNNLITSVTDINTCTSQLPYLWNGNSYTAAGTYAVTLVTSGGCDSVATLRLRVGAPVTSTTEITICNNQLPYTWNGNIYPIAGTFPVTLTSSNGCDSIATLNLVVKAILTSTTNVNVCDKLLPYLWSGNSYTTGGTYSVTLTTAAGCDSVPVLSLTVVPYVTSETDLTICSNQLPYTWNGKAFSAAGSYPVLLTGTSICDSLATLNLSVSAPIKNTVAISVCPSQLPYNWNGHIFAAAGTFTTILTTNSGCDSAVTLNLRVRATSTSSSTITICTSQLPYTWNGHNYTRAGTYAVTLPDRYGCDSIATLNLGVKANTTSTTEVTICSGRLPYSWNGQNFTNAGLHVVTLGSSSGCDSIATLDLIVHATPQAPKVLPLTYCQFNPAIALAATTTSADANLQWYSVISGGTGSLTAPIPSTSIAGVANYYVTQVSGLCESPRALIAVTVSAKPALGPDKNIKICFADSLNLTVLYNTTGLSSGWTTEQQPISFPDIVNLPGTYQLIVKNNHGCLDTSVVSLTKLPAVFANAGKDDNAEYNAPYQLSGTGNGQFEWSPPGQLSNPYIANPMATLTTDEIFILTVKNELGCAAYDTIKLRVLKGPSFYVPNAFTPNGDGNNDIFRPTAVGISSMTYFRIFNRYGELVFETANIHEGWDGTYRGIRQNIGNYVWMIKGTDRFGATKMLKGNVMLVR